MVSRIVADPVLNENDGKYLQLFPSPSRSRYLKLNRRERLMLERLLARARARARDYCRKGYVFAKVSSPAKEIEKSERTVRRALSGLKRRGIIERDLRNPLKIRIHYQALRCLAPSRYDSCPGCGRAITERKSAKRRYHSVACRMRAYRVRRRKRLTPALRFLSPPTKYKYKSAYSYDVSDSTLGNNVGSPQERRLPVAAPSSASKDKAIGERLLSLGLTPEVISRLKEFPAERIERNLKLASTRRVRHLAGWLLAAVKDDWAGKSAYSSRSRSRSRSRNGHQASVGAPAQEQEQEQERGRERAGRVRVGVDVEGLLRCRREWAASIAVLKREGLLDEVERVQLARAREELMRLDELLERLPEELRGLAHQKEEQQRKLRELQARGCLRCGWWDVGFDGYCYECKRSAVSAQLSADSRELTAIVKNAGISSEGGSNPPLMVFDSAAGDEAASGPGSSTGVPPATQALIMQGRR